MLIEELPFKIKTIKFLIRMVYEFSFNKIQQKILLSDIQLKLFHKVTINIIYNI